MRDAPLASFRLPSARVDGLRWAIPKTDRLLIPSGAMATKFVILDAVRQRRGSRDYIMNKPYARLVARLAPITKAEAQKVPPFNPFKLYANTTPLDAAERAEDGQQDAAVKIVELLGGIMPSEDGQELSTGGGRRRGEPGAGGRRGAGRAAAGLPCRRAGSPAPATRCAQARVPSCPSPTRPSWPSPCSRPRTRPTTSPDREVRVVKAQRGDTLARILLRLGAETWQARAMTRCGAQRAAGRCAACPARKCT